MKPRTLLAAIIGLLLAGGMAIGGGLSAAQDATPAPDAHPVHIHVGTCDNLDPAPLHVLSDITPTVESQGSVPVEISSTMVDAPLADIANGEHSINAHESVENIQHYIACGEIGALSSGDQAVIGLRELNGSGYTGIAILQAAGEQTEVTIYLANGLAGDTASAAAGGEVHAHEAAAATIDIVDFAYSPDPVTISAGESIMWTNQDSVAHSATGSDRDALQSGTMNQGDSFTQTFETAGTFEYFCEFHADMKGTIVVQE